MSTSTSEMDDSFRVLSLPPTATEAEIKKAYRKLSLRYHPDKAGKDVDPAQAAALFHEINLAYETLMDPAARARAVQRNAEDTAKRERQQQYEGKRRQMADELERSEKEALQKRQDADRRARERVAKIAELQQESRRLIKREQDEIDAKARQKHEALADKRRKDEEQAKAEREPELHPLDKTVRVQFPASQLAQLAGIVEGSIAPPTVPLSTPLANALANQFGELEHLQFQLPSSNKKIKRELMALATFKRLQDAWQAVVTGGEMRCTGLLEESFIGWANYTKKQRSDGSDARDKVYVEPKRVQWYRDHGVLRPSDVGRVRPTTKLHANVQPEAKAEKESHSSSQDTSKTSSATVYSKAYEARTLQRLRDAAKQSPLASAQPQPQAAQ
ncbi:related to cell cycle control protein cwf23 [Ustilago trichophora]|uniref:Related to cell cycle control protein cwf23 n=1 Tax=Ustilago trichophora TaxID=86804 RepID=A0A5C3E8Y3_9BASI|nr:related to cell cycle control protein cwf23 [Ustilago trichophora]